MAAQLVVFDPEIQRRCSGNCRRIPSLVNEAFAPDPVSIATLSRLPDLTSATKPDLVVLRGPAGRFFGESVAPLRRLWPSVPVIGAVCNISLSVSDLLESLADGLDDFVCCPFVQVDLITRLRKLLPGRGNSRAARLAMIGDLKLDMVVGESQSLLSTVARLVKVATSGATVLIGGETGVGKELFARAIHYNGSRKNNPFIPINCSGRPDHLLENELFGHAKGAYTDASTSEKGLVAEAEGGTLFLDEVDTLTPSSQAKLLRFLQDRQYRLVGSTKTFTADVRVIAAANADLLEMISAGRFRQDLFHRLNVLSLHVPPLRERITDIPLLAQHFLGHYAVQYGRADLRISQAALRKMMSYGWPGNVRELEGLLHRAIVFSSSNVIDADDVELPGTESPGISSPNCPQAKVMAEFERGYLSKLLAEHRGNVSHAAQAAGRDRRTFQRLLRKHRIDRAAFRNLI